MTVLIGLVAIVAVLGLGLRVYMGRAAEDRVGPDERIGLRALQGPLPPNGFLACPPGMCPAGGVPSPVFDVPWQTLAASWDALAARQPRTVRVAEDPEAHRTMWIQHSAGLQFPDIVTVEIVPLGDDRSSLAIYSRARYGRLDFGVNRKRVETWLGELQQQLGTAAAR